MNALIFYAFIKQAAELQLRDERTPPDYYAVHEAVLEKFPALEKSAFDWHGFKEGLVDEGIPLTGATIGAGLGGIRGAALGYAAGGTASLARSYLKGEKPSVSRRLLAAGALGYGVGGGAHAGLEHLTRNSKGLGRKMFHVGGSGSKLSRTVEEILPAAGATVATGIATGSQKKSRRKHEKP